MYCYCEAIHLTIHTLQNLVSGLKSLAKVIIDFHFISDDISKRGLISVEILPIAIVVAVVKRKIRLIPPFIEALIRIESIRISNKIHVLTCHRAVDTHMAYLSTLLTRHRSRPRSSSFFIRRSILALSISTSSSWWTLRVRV
jgi:hypothetical protein